MNGTFTVYAPAKLNLYLEVLDKRPDGYHNIKTLFEKIDLRDEIAIRKKDRGITVRVEPANACPGGKENIVYKALEKLAVPGLGLDIFIKKNIPVAAGLGGGSSDAASVLRAVNEKFNLGISVTRLFSIAAGIGKDVPFFMTDDTFSVGTLTGDKLEPIDTDWQLTHIVVKPDIAIHTSEMYKRLDGFNNSLSEVKIENTISALKKKDINLLQKSYYNTFEKVVFACKGYKEHIESIKNNLKEAGVGSCLLSGSGPSVFCTFGEREEAMDIIRRMPKMKHTDVFLAATYKGGIYGDN